MEVSFNTALNTLDENPSNYPGQQPLDERLLYVREIVDSKFQECNDPNGVCIRKAVSSAPTSHRKLQHDQFPVKDSNGILNKPLEISEQTSDLSANRMSRGMLLQNEKPFFKKAPNWFTSEPPTRINFLPTTTASSMKSRPKASNCTLTNTEVLQINGTNHPTGGIQVQMGPAVDIRSGLTIQTIESVHISPNPSAVPIHNNVATYCFQHEALPSSSLADLKKSHGDRHSDARNLFDSINKRHIQSTDYNDIRKVVHIGDTHGQPGTAFIRDSNKHSHDTNRTNDGDYSNGIEHFAANHIEGESITNSHKLSIGNENLQRKEAHSRKAISTEVDTSEFKPEVKNGIGEGNFFSNDDLGTSFDMGAASSCDGQKFRHIQSEQDHVPRSQICSNEFGAGSSSTKCERDVGHREEQKFKEVLEKIADIGKLRFHIRDTGIVPAECTQTSVDKKHCLADAEFGPLSEPEHFKTALENLCKSSQNEDSKIGTGNSGVFQGAINDFVKVFFDPNSQSSPQNSKSRDTVSTGNRGPDVRIDEHEVQTEKKKATKIPKQVKGIPEPKQMEYHHQSRSIVSSKIDSAAANDLSSTTKHPRAASLARQSGTSHSKQSNKYSKPVMLQRIQLSKGKVTQQEKDQSRIVAKGDKNRLENLDLKQPCVSDVDKVLKVYQDSMAAICLGTEHLSQLISHHVMKNAIATADQISSTIPNSTVTTRLTDAEPPSAGNETTPVEPVSKLVPQRSASIRQKNSTEPKLIRTIDSDQMEAARVPTPTIERSSISQQRDYQRATKDIAAYSNENNSVSTNETLVTAANECLLTLGQSTSGEEGTLSISNEKSTSVQSTSDKYTSSFTVASEESEQSPLKIRNQVDPKEHGSADGVRKQEGNEFSNIQYCVAEQLEGNIPIVGLSDEKNSRPQSDLKNQLSAYLDLENACGRDVRSHRRSDYDIHSDQTEYPNLHKCPVIISGPSDNLDASSDCNEKSTEGENVVQRREIELQIFGRILDSVKNSSQLMKRSIISLFNGMEIDSVDDIVRNLKDAEVHPIIIEQFLMILKERNREHTSFGRNLVLTNYKQPTNLVKNKDNMNTFEHSTAGLNGSMETTNIQIVKGSEGLVVCRTVENQATKTLDAADPEMNLNLNFNKDYNLNSQQDEVLKNKFISEPVESEVTTEKHITAEDLKNNYDNLVMSKAAFEKKSGLQNEVSDKPQQACQGGGETEICGSGVASLREQSNTNGLMDSMAINTASKNNDSESNTDKDISFQIPHDADVNDEDLDLFISHKASEILKSSTAEFVGLRTGINGQNSSKLNSGSQQNSRKLKSNSLAGRSVPANDNGKSKNPYGSAVDHPTSTKRLQTDDIHAVCRCRTSTEVEDSNPKPPHVPCQSLDAVNAIIDSQIQNDYKRLGLLDPDKKTGHPIPDQMTPKRFGPSKIGGTPKSYVRKSAEPGKSSVNKKKPSNNKVNEVRKSPRDNKQNSARGLSNDSEKSIAKHFCALCMQRRGKCSCVDCASCLEGSKGSKKGPVKRKTETPKPIRNVSIPRQSRSPKRFGHLAGKSPSQKESRPTSRSTAEPLECNSKYCRDGITKKRLETDKGTQIADSDFNNLKVEDKSQNTTKAADITACKSTEITQTACESKETFCAMVKLLDAACSIAPEKLDKVAEADTVDKQRVKDAGTVICFENRSPLLDLSTDSKNNCTDRVTTTREKITRSTETKDFTTISSQTSENCHDFQKHQATSMRCIPENETVSVIETTTPNIFDVENIVVLQPLNELDHTFFIAKPNSAERQMIREKMNRNFNVRTEEITDQPSVCELDQPENQTSEDALRLNGATSPMSFVECKECQASLPGSTVMENSSCLVAFAPKHKTDAKDSFSENHNECPEFCTNDEDCLGICPHSPSESDDPRYNCNRDCSNEETCGKICAPIPRVEASIQTSSIDINGIVETLNKLIAENNVPSIKLHIVKDLLQELRGVEDPMNVVEEKLGTIDERSEAQSVREIKNSIDGVKSRSGMQDSPRRSVQYDEPHEKVEKMVMNKKSLILHNVVRSVADMHPSTKVERLIIRPEDPLVAGSFNKSQADKRYSFFNKTEPGSSSIDVNDPRIKASLDITTEMARMKNRQSLLPNYPQFSPKSVANKLPVSGKSNNKNAAMLNKSRHGMHADTRPPNQFNKASARPGMKSFKSSKLEPEELSQVRTSFDDPTKLRRNIGKLSQDESKCEGPCDDKQNYPLSPQSTLEIIDVENKCEVRRESDETTLPWKNARNKADTTTSDVAEPIDSKLHDQSTRESVEKEGATPDNPDLDVINVAEKNTTTHETTRPEIDNDAHSMSNENQEAENPSKHFDRLVYRSSCNRPHIIDHFLGKRKLEDMEIEYDNNKTDGMSEGYPRLEDFAFKQLYMKSDFTPKTRRVLESSNIAESAAPSRKRYDERDWRSDHTSSDTYSEGEINLPSSCSYSVGEIKLSAPSSTTLGKSFQDPDGFTIFVTKSILDSTYATCTSPGEILAEIRKTATDSSSSLS